MSMLIDAGGPRDLASIPLATRRRRHIRNEERRESRPERLRAAVELWARERPNARLRSITGVYNCIGLVFASRRTWVDPDQLDIILTDDEYHRLSGPHEVQVGDIVVYRNKHDQNVTHVAVVVSIKPKIDTASWIITVMSKWGGDGEYIHLMEDIPLPLGEPVEYWTDRRMIP